MPRLEKPPGPSLPGNPLDHPMDGFDPLRPYQMVPLGGKRDLVVVTGNFKAELRQTTPGIAEMTDFRILRQAQPIQFPLPPVGSIILPERSAVQFTLVGRSAGATVIQGRDRPPGGPPLQPEFSLLVSVKAKQRREFAVCYLFDRITQDKGARQDFYGHFLDVDAVFERQANFHVVNIDGRAVGTRDARKILLDGSMGKTFDLDNKKLKTRIVDEFDRKFPKIAESVHAVVYAVPVPIRDSKNPASRPLGVNSRWRRQSTKRPYNVLWIGPQASSVPSTMGGPELSLVQQLRKTMAHEIGHSFGLEHDPVQMEDSTQLWLLFQSDPSVIYRPWWFNLMFPHTFIDSKRLNGAQIEALHNPAQGPTFPEVDQ